MDESDRDSIKKQYQQATSDAIQSGKLEENIQKEDPDSPFTVSGPVAVIDDAVPGSPSAAPEGAEQQPATKEEDEGMEWWLYLVFVALGVNVLCWFGVSGCFYMLWNKVSVQEPNPMAGGLLVGDDQDMDKNNMEEGSLLTPIKNDDKEGNSNGLHMVSDGGPTEVFKDEFSSSSDGDDGMPTPKRKSSMNPGAAHPFTPGADPTASTRGESSSEDISTPVVVIEETVEEEDVHGMFVDDDRRGSYSLNESSQHNNESNHVSKSGSSFSSSFQVAPKDEGKTEVIEADEWGNSDDEDEEETQDEGPSFVESAETDNDEPEETFEDEPTEEEEEPSVQPSTVSGLNDDDNATTDNDDESESSGYYEEDKAKEEQLASQPSEATAAQPSEASEIDGDGSGAIDDGFASDSDDEKESKATEEQSAQPSESSEVGGVDNATTDDDFDSEGSDDEEDKLKADHSAQPSAVESDDDDDYESDSHEGGEVNSNPKPKSSLFEGSDGDSESDFEESDFDDEDLA